MSKNEAYFPAKPGDPILAETWNDLQTKVRGEIELLSERLVGALSITGVESSGPIKLTGSGAIQRGGAEVPDSAELGLYAADGTSIRLATRGASVRVYGDASDDHPGGRIPNLELNAAGGAILRGHLSADNGLSVSFGATELRDLNVQGTSSLSGDVSVFGDLSVTGDTDLQALTVNASATLNQGLYVAGAPAKFTQGLTVPFGATNLRSLTVNDAATLNRGLSVSKGKTTVQDLAVDGTLTLKDGSSIERRLRDLEAVTRKDIAMPLVHLPLAGGQDITDESAYRRKATSQNVGFFTDDINRGRIIGTCALFEGSAMVTCTTSYARMEFTYTLWITEIGVPNREDPTPDLTLLGLSGSKVLAMSKKGIRLYSTEDAGNAVDLDLTIDLTQHTHIAITYRTVNGKNHTHVWVNGELHTTKVVATRPTCGGTLTIGDTHIPDGYACAIAQVRLYGRALSQAEIQEVMEITNA